MKAMAITRYGGPDTIETLDMPEPVPDPGQVSITVSHAAVGLIEALIRQGVFADQVGVPRPPLVPGLEVAGTIRALGDGVNDFTVGEPVVTLSILTQGGYAEVMVASAALTVSLAGADVDPGQAVAALPNATTAYLALSRATSMPAAAKVLVHGATGALASVFPGVATLLGAATVVGTVRTGDKRDMASMLSFDRVILSDELSLLGDELFDVIIDPVGGQLRLQSLDVLAPMGRLLAMGSADSHTDSSVDTNRVWLANHGIIGFNVGLFLTMTPQYAAPAARAVLPLLSSGAVHLPVITLPLDQAAEAHRMMDERTLPLGRVVLTL
jgi:NADPH2:quinone reductase